MSVHLDKTANLHPYECDGAGECPHCDKTLAEGHDPRTCALCRWDAREVLVHLNVLVDRDDQRNAAEIAMAIMGALEVGSDDESVATLGITVPLTEEVG